MSVGNFSGKSIQKILSLKRKFSLEFPSTRWNLTQTVGQWRDWTAKKSRKSIANQSLKQRSRKFPEKSARTFRGRDARRLISGPPKVFPLNNRSRFVTALTSQKEIVSRISLMMTRNQMRNQMRNKQLNLR